MTWPSWGLACILLNRRLAFALSDLSRRRSSGEGALKITSMFMFIQHSIKSVNVTVNVTNAPSVNHTQQNLNESKSHSGN